MSSVVKLLFPIYLKILETRGTRDKESSEKSRLLMSDLSDWVVTKICFPDHQNLAPEEAFVQIGKKRAIYRVEHRTENFEEKKNYIEINTTAVENIATWWPGSCMGRIAFAGIEGKYKIQNTKYKIQKQNTATWWPGSCMGRIAVAGIEGK